MPADEPAVVVPIAVPGAGLPPVRDPIGDDSPNPGGPVGPVDWSEVGYENVGGTEGGADPVTELAPALPVACKSNAEVQFWTALVTATGGNNVFGMFCRNPGGGGAWAGAFPPVPAPAPAPAPAAAAAAAGGAGCASSLEGGSYHHGGVSTSRPSQSASSQALWDPAIVVPPRPPRARMLMPNTEPGEPARDSSPPGTRGLIIVE